jgi:hypothetical protein
MKSRGWKHCPPSFIHPTAKENEMKLQILDEGLDSNGEGEQLFHFLTSLTQEKNYAHDSRYNTQTTVSFFNEVSIEKKNYPRSWFHFLMSLKA